MTKRELISTLARKMNVSKREAESWVDALSDTVMERVSQGEKVSITGFGVFTANTRASRRGVDPRTQAEIEIPSMRMPRFRAGKRFKEAVRK